MLYSVFIYMKKYHLFAIFALLLIPAAFSFAQSSCGTITGPVDIYDSNPQIETHPITDCANPFSENTDGEPNPYKIILLGNSIADGGEVEVPVGGTADYSIAQQNGFLIDDGMVYRHDGQNYIFVETRRSKPTESEYRAYAQTFFPSGTDIELYVAAAPTRDTSELTEEEEENLYDFLEYVHEHYVPVRPTLQAGTYSLVIVQPVPDPYIGLTFVLTFTLVEAEPEPQGASSVLFLPGIQASRLYKDGLFGTEDRIWEPNNPTNDIDQLSMTESGESLHEVYTRDVIDVAPGSIDIYAGFLNFVEGLVSEEVINEFHSFAYDWRYDVFDVATNGTQYENDLKRLDNVVNQMASDSKSKKVTIVAHSNGGLLAKALLIEHPELAAKVDHVIFVGSPQLGTPKAIGAVLHGLDQSLMKGWFLSSRDARNVLLNFPGVYGLLPGEQYLENVSEPIITFDNTPETGIFRITYGNSIDSQAELKDFLSGSADARPEAEFTNDAARANQELLNTALEEHRQELDNWSAPDGVAVTEIVGVGLNTISGFHYQGFGCSRVNCGLGRVYKPIPVFSRYGDQTVIASSAEGYEGDKNLRYVDLLASDAAGEVIEHANLTESNSVQTLVRDVLIGQTTQSIPFVSTERPQFNTDSVLIGAHSPVTLLVKDQTGNVVGKIGTSSNGFPIFKEEIPGSSYFEMAESKYVVVPKGLSFDVEMKGIGSGNVTFTVHNVSNDEQQQIIHIPISDISTTTSLTVHSNGTNFGNLKVDKNGDGQIEQEVTPSGEVVIPPPIESLYTKLLKMVKSLDLKPKYKLPVVLAVETAKVLSEKGKGPIARLAERTVLKELVKLLNQYQSQKLISGPEYNNLVGIIKQIIGK